MAANHLLPAAYGGAARQRRGGDRRRRAVRAADRLPAAAARSERHRGDGCGRHRRRGDGAYHRQNHCPARLVLSKAAAGARGNGRRPIRRGRPRGGARVSHSDPAAEHRLRLHPLPRRRVCHRHRRRAPVGAGGRSACPLAAAFYGGSHRRSALCGHRRAAYDRRRLFSSAAIRLCADRSPAAARGHLLSPRRWGFRRRRW